ncbi:CHASE2 domain-containing protein [Sphingosinicellaceae bacterium]|nr:CHASE2 domain-containing protein [Sphingosinicellaceae bacterium]
MRLAGVTGAVIVAALLAWLAGPLFAEPLFDRYQRWAPRTITNPRVHVVRIDNDSLKRVGPWPWPRAYFTQMTQRLNQAGASVVAFDVLFAENDPSDPTRFIKVFPELSEATRKEITALPAPDEDFGRALWEAPTVVARAGVRQRSLESNALNARGTAALTISARFDRSLPGASSFDLALANVAPIEFNAHGQGLINGEPDRDGVTRRMILAANVGGRPMPGFALEIVRVAEHADDIGVGVVAGRLTALVAGSYRVPVDPEGRARLYFGRMLDDDESAAADVIDPKKSLAYLKGKIVIVGPTSIGLGDIRTTPLGETEFGVRIHAQAVDALLSGAWLSRPRWALPAEWTLGALLALFACLVFPRLRGRAVAVVPLVVAAIVVASSWGAFVLWRLLLDPTRPLLIGGGAALAVAATAFIQTGHNARAMREATLAREGEMKGARDIQRAMLPDARSVATLDPRLDIAALIEPAQLIGGDLYDAFALDDGRIVFLVGDVTGKGTPAALFMAVTKALAHSLLGAADAPPLNEIVGELNCELAIDSVVEVTMLCGILDPATGRIELVNAGHENPWIVRADGSAVEHVMEGGLPLCTVPDYAYPLEILTLAPGEGLVVITDGVREAQDDKGGFFGSDRTHAVLAGWTGSAQGLTKRLASAVREFEAGTPATDDLTVMALRYRGPVAVLSSRD